MSKSFIYHKLFKRLTFALLSIITISKTKAQQNAPDSFYVSGQVLGRDTGVVRLFYTDRYGLNHREDAVLNTGKFQFAGVVAGVCDGYLYTDLQNINMSDSTVVRFLLEPGDIYIEYKDKQSKISGGTVQQEKEKLDAAKSGINMYSEKIKQIDFDYIVSNRGSHLSAFLLKKYHRVLQLDTLIRYYDFLLPEVKSSDEGMKLLRYIYPLTTDKKFRDNNPVFGKGFNDSLNDIKSVHDFKLPNQYGKLTDFKQYKNNYLLIEFWASWCSPCIAQMPFLKQLEEAYKNHPLKIISVSLDTDKGRWEETIKKNNLTGTQLLESSAFAGLLPVYCKVYTALPRFVLINPDGKIINYDTPFPSEPELKILLDSYLKQKVKN